MSEKESSPNLGSDYDPTGQIADLVQRLAETEAAIRALTAGQMDAVLDPSGATPVLLRQAQAALQESEARYRRLLAHISAVVFEMAPDGTILFVNEAMTSITGYRPEELEGHNWQDLPLLKAQGQHAQELIRMLEWGDLTAYELTLTAQDGTPITLELNTANHYGPDGTLQRIVGIGIDRTRRKQAEAERDKALLDLGERVKELTFLQHVTHILQDRHKSLARMLEEIVARLPEAWQYPHTTGARITLGGQEFATPNFARTPWMQQATFAAHQGEHGSIEICYLEQRPPRAGGPFLAEERRTLDSLAEMLELHLERLETEAAWRRSVQELEIRVQERTAEMMQANEELQVFNEELEIIEDELRTQNQALAAARDDLEAERRRYQELFEFAPDGYLVTDARGVIRQANRAAADLLAVRQDSLVGKPLDLYLTQENHTTFSRQLRQLKEEEQASRLRSEVSLRPPTGDVFPAAMTLAPIRDAQGQLVGLRCLLRDITERVRLQAERERLLVQAGQDRESILELARDLARERDTLDAIMENTGTCLAYLDPRFNFVRVNSAYADGSGHSREELIGSNHFELFPNPENQAIFEQVRDTGQPVEFRAKPFEYADQPERGVTYWDWTLAPVKDQAERVQGLVLSLLDVTGQERAKQALRESEARYRRLFDSMTEGFAVHEIVCDPEGKPCDYRFLEVNPAFEALTGLKQADVLGKAVLEIMPDTEPFWIETYGRVALTGEPVHFEQFSAVLSRTYEVFAYCPAEKQFACLFLDVTERKQAEEALRESERKLKILFEILPVGVSILDAERKITYMNPALERILDISEEKLMAGNYRARTYVRPDGTPMPAEEFASARAIREQREVHDVETGVMKEDGTVIWTNVSAVPVAFPDWKVVIVTADITERVRAESQKEAAIEALHRAHDELEVRVKERTSELAQANAKLQVEIAERRGAEEALHLERNRLKSILDGMENGVWIVSQQYDIEYVNPVTERDFGPAIGRKCYAYFHDLRDVCPWCRNQEVFDGKIVKREWHSLKTGKTYDLVDTPLRNADGSVSKMEIMHDITQRKQVEEELRSSEERFRQLAENVREVFWITDPAKSQMLYVSPAYEEIWGRSCQSLYERADAFLDAVHPEDREWVIASLPRQVVGGYDEQYRIVRPDKSVRWIRARAFPVRNAQGQVYRIAGISEDVTERALAFQILEQRVEERTRELSTLLETSRHLASTLDMERLLEMILDQLKAIVECSGATIYKMVGDELTALAHRGPITSRELLELRFSVRGMPAFEEAIRQQAPVVIPDVQGDTPLARLFQEKTGEQLHTTLRHIHSWMGVPLLIQERPIGMLGLHHSQPNYYTRQHAELAMTFANQAAMALENARLYEQARELAAMQERQRLARDLHDSVSQTLFSASLSAGVFPRLWERDPEAGRLCLEELQQLTRGALAEMRTLLLELRPSGLIEVEFGDLLAQLAEAITSRTRVPVALKVEGHWPLPPDVQVTLYRIAQEALNNVAKHAGANKVEVGLRYLSPGPSPIRGGEYLSPGPSPTRGGESDHLSPGSEQEGIPDHPSPGRGEEGVPDHPSPLRGGEGGEVRGVELLIVDDGQGFDPQDVLPQHLGLGIMRERAEAIGATFEIQSQIGQGTRIRVAWNEEDE